MYAVLSLVYVTRTYVKIQGHLSHFTKRINHANVLKFIKRTRSGDQAESLQG